MDHKERLNLKLEYQKHNIEWNEGYLTNLKNEAEKIKWSIKDDKDTLRLLKYEIKKYEKDILKMKKKIED